MRPAPAVGVRCGDSLAWRAAQALLPGLAGAALAAWAGGHLQAGAAAQVALAAGAGAAAAALAWRGAGCPARALAWDGRAWTLDGREAEVAVAIDLGRWMLLRHRAPGRGPAPWEWQGRWQWLAASAAEAGPAWHGLRAALHARPGPAPALPPQG